MWGVPQFDALSNYLAMGQNLCLHFGADEHPCTTYFDVHQGNQGFDPQPFV